MMEERVSKVDPGIKFIGGKCPTHPHCQVAGIITEHSGYTFVHVSELLLATLKAEDALLTWMQVWARIIRQQFPGFYEEAEREAKE